MTTYLALVIEDYRDQAMVFATALQKAGFQTESIIDGAQAQQRLKEIVPALVVLDLHIPTITGEVLLRQIRSDPRLADTRIILATADALRAEVLRPEVDMVLLKPISFTQLSDLAARLLKAITLKNQS